MERPGFDRTDAAASQAVVDIKKWAREKVAEVRLELLRKRDAVRAEVNEVKSRPYLDPTDGTIGAVIIAAVTALLTRLARGKPTLANGRLQPAGKDDHGKVA